MNRISLLAAALALGALAVAVHAWTAARRAEELGAAIGVERDQLAAQLRSAQGRAVAAEERAVRLGEEKIALQMDLNKLFSKKAEVATVPTTRGAAPTSAPVGGAANRGSMAPSLTGTPIALPTLGFRSWSASTPFRGSREAALDTTYHVLYRQLKLSPEQIDQFKAISAAAAERFDELDRLARDRNTRPTDPALQPLYVTADAELKAKMAALAGADALPVIQHFVDTLFLRDAILPLVSELFYTPSPLTESQSSRLVEIMWKNMRDPFGKTNPVFGNARAMVDDAQEILDARQLIVWKQFIDFHANSSFGSLQPRSRGRR